MLSKLRERLNYANVVATIALFAALGGSSYAALRISGREIVNNSVRSADLRNNDVRGRDIRNGTVTSRDVRDSSLLARDFAAGQLPAGPPGPPAQLEGVAAGGDLAGTYPSPTIAASAVSSADVADGSLRRDDIALISVTLTEDSTSIGADQCRTLPIAVPGALPSDHALVATETSDSNINLGPVAVSAFTVSDQAVIKICNNNPFAFDPGPATFRLLIIR